MYFAGFSLVQRSVSTSSPFTIMLAPSCPFFSHDVADSSICTCVSSLTPACIANSHNTTLPFHWRWRRQISVHYLTSSKCTSYAACLAWEASTRRSRQVSFHRHLVLLACAARLAPPPSLLTYHRGTVYGW